MELMDSHAFLHHLFSDSILSVSTEQGCLLGTHKKPKFFQYQKGSYGNFILYT